MANNLAAKINISSKQVLKTLLVLLEGNYTMSELVDKLNKNEKGPVFNNSVVSKYINTCRYIEIDIPKVQNKYYVAGLPFGLNFSNDDVDLIEHMFHFAKTNFSSFFNEKLNNFIEKLNKYSNKNITKIESGTEDNVRERLEKAIGENRRVKLYYKNNEITEVNPLEIFNNNGKLCVTAEGGQNEKVIPFEKLSGIEILDKKFLPPKDNKAVVFKLYGGLAHRYELRENEMIMNQHEDGIVISNTGEPREILFSRLLRYDSLCEVLEPERCREEMMCIIENMLANYEE